MITLAEYLLSISSVSRDGSKMLRDNCVGKLMGLNHDFELAQKLVLNISQKLLYLDSKLDWSNWQFHEVMGFEK